MPFFICPNCKQRSIDIDRQEGLYNEAVACHHCGFGFLFELMDDYYPAPDAGFVVCDKEGRILAVGRGVFEMTGWNEGDLIGVDVVQGLGLAGARVGCPAAERGDSAADPVGPHEARDSRLLSRLRRRRRPPRGVDARASIGMPWTHSKASC
jgi:PAS domain-containing protein